MKTTEFRIGNLIYWNIPEKIGVTHEIVVIKENRINTIPISLGESMDDYLPIELTEDWLKLFGFEEDVESKSWSILTTLDKYDYQFEVSNKYQEYFQPDFARMNIKYVHQLQNLFFALTGVELQLSST